MKNSLSGNSPEIDSMCLWRDPGRRLFLRPTIVGTTANSNIMMHPIMSNSVSVASTELATTTSTTTTITVTTNTATTITSGFNLYIRPTITPWTDSNKLISVSSLPSTVTVNSIVTPVMAYGHLESMNKWSLPIPDPERHYLYQPNQASVWNPALMENAGEITLLHNEVEKVKLDQNRLEQELDYILSQQKELEHLLTPLEEFVKEQSEPFNLLHVDKEYERIYKLAENIDAELKRMSQDLKDIIVHLNSLGTPADATELLQQICSILNAHMHSLQWISQNSGIMQKKVEEVTKVFEDYHRKEQECNMKMTFE